MTKRTDREKFERTTAAIDDAIFAASREELEAEYRELGMDPAEAIARARKQIASAIAASGKKAMQAAKQRVELAKERAPRLAIAASTDPAAMRAKLTRLLRQPGVPTTLAARQGKEMSDRDVESLIADLAELGIVEKEPRE